MKKIKVLKVVSKACCDPDPQRPPGCILSAPAGSLGSAELALVLRVTLSSGLSLLPLSTPVCAAPGAHVPDSPDLRSSVTVSPSLLFAAARPCFVRHRTFHSQTRFTDRLLPLGR